MSVVALTNDPVLGCGWHNRDYQLTNSLFGPVTPGETNIGSAAFPVFHFQDDAVVGGLLNSAQQSPTSPLFYQPGPDGPSSFTPFSEDLAFRLYKSPTPEPSSIILLGSGLLAAAGVIRRRMSA